jgi:hypothetical protein
MNYLESENFHRIGLTQNIAQGANFNAPIVQIGIREILVRQVNEPMLENEYIKPR